MRRVFDRPTRFFFARKFMKKTQKQIGEYFADYDEESGLFCVFHTDKKTGFAYSSWACMEDAEKAAKKRNEEMGLSEPN